MPDPEFAGLLALRPRALIVGRLDPDGRIPSVPANFAPDPTVSEGALPEAVSPVWKSMASGGSTGDPSSSRQAATAGCPRRSAIRWEHRRATSTCSRSR